MTSSSSTNTACCAVDIRLFLLTTIISMLGAFWAGFAFVPPQTWVDSVSSSIITTSLISSLPFGRSSSAQQTAARSTLELSQAAGFTSLDHSPSGQHLLVDIEGIEADFLDSEERLASAMVRTVQEAGLTMLSYHCHKLMPAGISCVGVLLESHISFHTWPEEGVITLDLFTCGANPLLPVVPVIERLFGIPKPGMSHESLNIKWAHELRGFRSHEEKRKNYLDNFSDLSIWILSPLEIHTKKMIYSNLTKYQRVDIWDLSEPENTPTFEDGIKHNLTDGDPRWMQTDYYTPDRILFLDGILQSMYSHESDYHEALVHPAMFAHSGPAHVAIIGGGEGATLREVLKHKTVQHVKMIEIDEELIQIAREYLPKMSDCSNLVGRADNCFDDDIVDVVSENGLKWFKDRYSSEAEAAAPDNPFDVIIVDALDPEDDVPFTTDLYVDPIFVSSIMSSLAEDGVIMIQIGTAAELDDPRPDIGTYQIREKLFRLFEEHHQVAAMHVYEEPRSGYLEPHSFLIVCKSVSCRSRWYARSDAIDYQIYNRIVKTKSGKGALNSFDGTTQQSYQVPQMAWETVYCRREPTPFECAYRQLDMTKDVYEFETNGDSSFVAEIHKNENGEIIGSSVTAKVDIPKGSYIMPEHLAKSLVLNKESTEGIKSNAEIGAPLFDELARFVEWNAHNSHMDGDDVRYLEVGASILMREVNSEGEANVGRWVPAIEKRPTYSPVYDRHRMSFDVFMVATQDIAAGSELKRLKNMWTA